MSETEDAREQAEIALEVYADLFRGEQEDRQRARVAPDDLIRLPNHHAIASLITGAQRGSSFYAHSEPPAPHDSDRAAHHLRRQRDAGAEEPGPMRPPAELAPIPDYASVLNDDASESAHASAPAASAPLPSAAQPPAADTTEPSESPPPPPTRAQRSAASDAAPPPSYRAVHQNVRALTWDESPRKPNDDPPHNGRALALLAALWQHKVMLASQLARLEFGGTDLTRARKLLARMWHAGWVDRSRFSLPRGQGPSEYAYWLTQPGFRLAKQNGAIPPNARWRRDRPTDHRLVTQPLQVIAWVLCYRDSLGPHLSRWVGEPHGTLDVPPKPGKPRTPLEYSDIQLEGYAQLRGLKAKRPGRIVPDATLQLDFPDKNRRFDLLVELDRSQRPALNVDKLHRYDALITCWWRALPRYQDLGEPPAALFICAGEGAVRALLERADRELTGALIPRPGDPKKNWRYPARERTMFTHERAIHERELQAFMLPLQPAAEAGVALEPREVSLPCDRG